MSNLERLDLSGNQLQSLPVELGRLTGLEELDLRDNPLEAFLARARRRGTGPVLEYLRELAKGAKRRYEGKLILLGYGGEGKTCVSRALRGRKFRHQVRTAGVEVTQWRFANPRFADEWDKEITLNIWDFEGQEINHQSHQLFLTEQALYVLVINGRREFRMERAEYWLDTIRARAPQSRVILVASECEDTTPSWPLDKLKAAYGELLRGDKWYFAVGCETGKGIKALGDEIKSAAADMEVMGKEWPKTYEDAEDRIRESAKEQAHVSRDQLRTIFTDSAISKGAFDGVAQHLAALGIITMFGDSPELEDFCVLNPQWLTKAISLVMEDPRLEEDKGEIIFGRMRELWDAEYPGMYPTFHNCMKGFELCYDMEDKEGCLIPLWFGDRAPQIPWSEIAGAKERRIEYRLNIRPPKGIMSRFIVKTHHMIVKTEAMPKGVYWRNGVFLATGEGEYRSEALCEFDHDERTLRINVRAAFPQNMIEQLHAFAKAVFGFYEGLRPERKYGCVKFEQESEAECPGAHSERRIYSALLKNRIIDCEYGWHDVEPKRLVYGFSSFGRLLVSTEELEKAVKEGLREVAGDVMTLLVEVDKLSGKADEIKQQGERLPAEIGQQVELKLRDYLGLLDEMLDNRDFNSAPAVVGIAPADGSRWDPRGWFNKRYRLVPYCEHAGGVHPVGFSVEFKKPRVWWQKTAPKLALAVKVLSAGIQIACAGLPMKLDAEMFEAIKNEAAFMKELAGHLELEGGAESDISDEAGEFVERLGRKAGGGFERLRDVRDLRQLRGDDQKRIVRMQLAELFAEIAPREYKARQWGQLRRTRMPDSTYRWLCPAHAAESRR